MDFKHELVIPNDDLPFRMVLYECINEDNSIMKHWHRCIEVFMVKMGTVDYYINDVHYPLREEEVMLVSSNEIHSIKASDLNRSIVLQIPVSAFEVESGSEQAVVFSNSNPRKDEELKKIITNMYQTYEKKEYGYEFKVKSQYFMLLHILVTKYKEKNVSEERVRENKHLNRLSQITEYLRNNYEQEISLEGVAKMFGFSPTYLSRMFQKYAKINYRSYLQSIRVQYGYKELLNTDHSISEVALNNGFPNSKSFTKAFEKQYGILPSAYRGKMKKDKNLPLIR